MITWAFGIPGVGQGEIWASSLSHARAVLKQQLGLKKIPESTYFIPIPIGDDHEPCQHQREWAERTIRRYDYKLTAAIFVVHANNRKYFGKSARAKSRGAITIAQKAKRPITNGRAKK